MTPPPASSRPRAGAVASFWAVAARHAAAGLAGGGAYVVLSALGLDAVVAAALGLVTLGLAATHLASHERAKTVAAARWIERATEDRDPGRPDREILELAPEFGRALLRFHVRARSRALAAAADLRWREAVLDTIVDPIATLDGDGVVTSANAEAEQVLRIKVGDALALNLRSPVLRDAIDQALSSPERPARMVIAAKTEIARAGRSFACRVAPTPTPDGRHGVVLAFRDRSDAVRLAKMRRDFVADLSHEIKTPLAAMTLAIETLTGPARDDPAGRERFLRLLADEAASMRKLVEDLTSLSKIESDATPLAPVDLRATLALLEQRFLPMVEAAGGRLTFDVARPLDDVLGDEAQLTRLVSNLLDNALKYGGRDIRVWAGRKRAVEEDSYVPPGGEVIEIAVSDDGVGLAPEHVTRVTERFFRADSARTRRKSGAGLGLALAKHIARRHRGRLAIESEPGAGATFALRLPARDRPGHQTVTVAP